MRARLRARVRMRVNIFLFVCGMLVTMQIRFFEGRNISKDRIVYLNGLTFDRHFTDWREGEGYTLLIGRPQGRARSRVEWHIEPLGPTQSSLSITVYPDLLHRMPRWLRWAAFQWKVKPLLKAYLDAVTGGIAHWLETGTPVRREDHPDHPWFGHTRSSPS